MTARERIHAAIVRLLNAIDEGRDSGEFTDKGIESLDAMEKQVEALTTTVDHWRQEDEQ